MEVNISKSSAYGQTAGAAAAQKQEEVQKTGAAVQEGAAETVESVKAPNQDVYESNQDVVEEDAGTYKPNAAMIDKMKAELEQIQNRFITMVRDMLGKQNKQIGLTDDNLWKIIAQGDYEVDPETKAAAQESISADGYWGVEQTSQRLVGFAKALVGGDPARVEEMREAFIKGYEAAEEAWGGQLPEIAQQTYDATMKLFDEWAASAGEETSAVETAPAE